MMPQKSYAFYSIIILFTTLLQLASSSITPEELHEDTKETASLPHAIIITSIIAFVITNILSTATCVILWYTFFSIYAHVYRVMWSLEEKLRIGTRRLSDRKFGDDILAQIHQMAPYDSNMNNQEISTMLKSVYHSQQQNNNPAA